MTPILKLLGILFELDLLNTGALGYFPWHLANRDSNHPFIKVEFGNSNFTPPMFK